VVDNGTVNILNMATGADFGYDVICKPSHPCNNSNTVPTAVRKTELIMTNPQAGVESRV
jgi:hypothetical protein